MFTRRKITWARIFSTLVLGTFLLSLNAITGHRHAPSNGHDHPTDHACPVCSLAQSLQSAVHAPSPLATFHESIPAGPAAAPTESQALPRRIFLTHLQIHAPPLTNALS